MVKVMRAVTYAAKTLIAALLDTESLCKLSFRDIA